MKKKDKTLGLSVHYKELDKIAIKNKCRMVDSFGQLQTVGIYFRIDLRFIYHWLRVSYVGISKIAFTAMPLGLLYAHVAYKEFMNRTFIFIWESSWHNLLADI